MKKLGPKAMKWLKCVHLLTIGAWLGGSFSLVIMTTAFSGAGGEALYGLNLAIHTVDVYVVTIVGAVGTLITGLVYGFLTGWGFFKHRWLLVKWVLTLSIIVFGTFWLGPWEEAMLAISQKTTSEAANSGEYLALLQNFSRYGPVCLGLLVFMVILSVFKPWKKNRTGADLSKL